MRSSDPIVTIDNGNWGDTSLSAVGAVLESTASVLCDAFGRAPDAPVQVSPWDRGPTVAWDLRPYRVWISARDTYWCQYAYQFSHELCHILVNFDQVRRHRHKWFEESKHLRAFGTLRAAPTVPGIPAQTTFRGARRPRIRPPLRDLRQAGRTSRAARAECRPSDVALQPHSALGGEHHRPQAEPRGSGCPPGRLSGGKVSLARLRLPEPLERNDRPHLCRSPGLVGRLPARQGIRAPNPPVGQDTALRDRRGCPCLGQRWVRG